MPFRPTPRLCAQCGKDVSPEEGGIQLEESRSGEQILVHQACFDEQFKPLAPQDGSNRSD